MDTLQNYNSILAQIDNEKNNEKSSEQLKERAKDALANTLIENSFLPLAENHLVHNGIKYAFDNAKNVYQKIGEFRDTVNKINNRSASFLEGRSPLPDTEPVKRPTQLFDVTQDQNKLSRFSGSSDTINDFNTDNPIKISSEIQKADSIDSKLVKASKLDSIGEDVTDGLMGATDASEVLDETPIGDILTGILGVSTLIAGGIEHMHHKTHPELIANPSTQFGA